MLISLTAFADRLGLDPRALVLAGLLCGSVLVFLSLASMARAREADHLRKRMLAVRAGSGGRAPYQGEDASLFLAPDIAVGKLAGAFLPSRQPDRNKVRHDLKRAGFSQPKAVLAYYALRVGAGLVLPAVLAMTFLYREALPLPGQVAMWMGQISGNGMLMLFAVMIVVGFYGPALWLSSRAKDRRQRIELGFPNALDLMQVSIETGLGFDAALARVSSELVVTAPDIAQEFTVAQQEILAGRDREGAYQAMAERLAIDEAHAFVNVVLQSFRFGTSMSQSLLAYSADMRERRELRAQEKANKLPVLMSAVMATLMMPALLIVTIGPVVLRYVSTFQN